jgi:hypothetical protein
VPELSGFACLLSGWDERYPEFPYGAEETCRAWAAAMCGFGGHDWFLEIDCEDGVSLHCIRCPAGPDDIYPDGADVLTGNFEVRPGYVLTLSTGYVLLNDEECDDYDRWAGPVTAVLRVEQYTSLDMISPEYDVWIEVDPR